MTTSSNASMAAKKKNLMNHVDIKADQALDLRRQGLTYEAIANKVDYADRATAYNAVKRLLEREYQVTQEKVEEYRSEELARLDDILSKLMDRVGQPVRHIKTVRGEDHEFYDFDGDLQVVDRILKLMDRRAKLLGLDAPTKTETNLHIGITHEEALKELE